MDFIELIKERYACRNYSPQKVHKNILYDIVTDALNAPSARNTQPWSFYITNSEEENEKIRVCLQDEGRNKFLNGATAFIVVFEDIPDNIACAKYGNDRFVKYDIGEVVAYLTLSAKNRGIDTCVIGWINEEALQKNTGVNKHCGIVIALGYAALDVKPTQKNRVGIDKKIINYKENYKDD